MNKDGSKCFNLALYRNYRERKNYKLLGFCHWLNYIRKKSRQASCFQRGCWMKRGLHFGLTCLAGFSAYLLGSTGERLSSSDFKFFKTAVLVSNPAVPKENLSPTVLTAFRKLHQIFTSQLPIIYILLE